MPLLQNALIGFLVGAAGGMFGIGGGIVLIPALTLVYGPDQHLYQAASMMVNVCVSVPAVYQHWRWAAIESATVVRLVPLAILFVILGVWVSETRLFSGHREAYLQGVFGAFLVGCALGEAYRIWRPCLATVPHNEAQKPTMTSGLITAIAAPTGFIAGLLGVGGGILAVPLQRRLLRVPLRSAIANSAAVVVATGTVGGLMKNYAYYAEHGTVQDPLTLAAVIAPTAVVGSLVGSRLTHRAPISILRQLFILVLLIAAFRLLIGAMAAW